jgi:hypothetical protein
MKEKTCNLNFRVEEEFKALGDVILLTMGKSQQEILKSAYMQFIDENINYLDGYEDKARAALTLLKHKQKEESKILENFLQESDRFKVDATKLDTKIAKRAANPYRNTHDNPIEKPLQATIQTHPVVTEHNDYLISDLQYVEDLEPEFKQALVSAYAQKMMQSPNYDDIKEVILSERIEGTKTLSKAQVLKIRSQIVMFIDWEMYGDLLNDTIRACYKEYICEALNV